MKQDGEICHDEKSRVKKGFDKSVWNKWEASRRHKFNAALECLKKELPIQESISKQKVLERALEYIQATKKLKHNNDSCHEKINGLKKRLQFLLLVMQKTGILNKNEDFSGSYKLSVPVVKVRGQSEVLFREEFVYDDSSDLDYERLLPKLQTRDASTQCVSSQLAYGVAEPCKMAEDNQNKHFDKVHPKCTDSQTSIEMKNKTNLTKKFDVPSSVASVELHRDYEEQVIAQIADSHITVLTPSLPNNPIMSTGLTSVLQNPRLIHINSGNLIVMPNTSVQTCRKLKKIAPKPPSVLPSSSGSITSIGSDGAAPLQDKSTVSYPLLHNLETTPQTSIIPNYDVLEASNVAKASSMNSIPIVNSSIMSAVSNETYKSEDNSRNKKISDDCEGKTTKTATSNYSIMSLCISSNHEKEGDCIESVTTKSLPQIGRASMSKALKTAPLTPSDACESSLRSSDISPTCTDSNLYKSTISHDVQSLETKYSITTLHPLITQVSLCTPEKKTSPEISTGQDVSNSSSDPKDISSTPQVSLSINANSHDSTKSLCPSTIFSSPISIKPLKSTIFSLDPINSFSHPFPFCPLSLTDAPTTFSFTLTSSVSTGVSNSMSKQPVIKSVDAHDKSISLVSPMPCSSESCTLKSKSPIRSNFSTSSVPRENIRISSLKISVEKPFTACTQSVKSQLASSCTKASSPVNLENNLSSCSESSKVESAHIKTMWKLDLTSTTSCTASFATTPSFVTSACSATTNISQIENSSATVASASECVKPVLPSSSCVESMPHVENAPKCTTGVTMESSNLCSTSSLTLLSKSSEKYFNKCTKSDSELPDHCPPAAKSDENRFDKPKLNRSDFKLPLAPLSSYVCSHATAKESNTDESLLSGHDSAYKSLISCSGSSDISSINTPQNTSLNKYSEKQHVSEIELCNNNLSASAKFSCASKNPSNALVPLVTSSSSKEYDLSTKEKPISLEISTVTHSYQCIPSPSDIKTMGDSRNLNKIRNEEFMKSTDMNCVIKSIRSPEVENPYSERYNGLAKIYSNRNDNSNRGKFIYTKRKKTSDLTSELTSCSSLSTLNNSDMNVKSSLPSISEQVSSHSSVILETNGIDISHNKMTQLATTESHYEPQKEKNSFNQSLSLKSSCITSRSPEVPNTAKSCSSSIFVKTKATNFQTDDKTGSSSEIALPSGSVHSSTSVKYTTIPLNEQSNRQSSCQPQMLKEQTVLQSHQGTAQPHVEQLAATSSQMRDTEINHRSSIEASRVHTQLENNHSDDSRVPATNNVELLVYDQNRKVPCSPRENSQLYQSYSKNFSGYSTDSLNDCANPMTMGSFLDHSNTGLRTSQASDPDQSRGFSVSHLVSRPGDSRKTNNPGLSVYKSPNNSSDDKRKDSPKSKGNSRKLDAKSKSSMSTTKTVLENRHRSPARSMSVAQYPSFGESWNSKHIGHVKQNHSYTAEALIGPQSYVRPNSRQTVHQNYHFMSSNQMYQGHYPTQQLKSFPQSTSINYHNHDRNLGSGCGNEYNFQLHPQTAYGANVSYVPSGYPYQNLPAPASASSSMLSSELIPPGAGYSRLHDIMPDQPNFPFSIDSQEIAPPSNCHTSVSLRSNSEPSLGPPTAAGYYRGNPPKNSTQVPVSSYSSTGNGKRMRLDDGHMAQNPTNTFLEAGSLSHLTLHSLTPPCDDGSISHPVSCSRQQNSFFVNSDNLMALNSNHQYGASIPMGGSLTVSDPVMAPLDLLNPQNMSSGEKSSNTVLPSSSSGQMSYDPYRMERQQMANMAGPQLSSSLSNFNLTSIIPEINSKAANDNELQSQEHIRHNQTSNINQHVSIRNSVRAPTASAVNFSSKEPHASQRQTVNNPMGALFQTPQHMNTSKTSTIPLSVSTFGDSTEFSLQNLNPQIQE